MAKPHKSKPGDPRLGDIIGKLEGSPMFCLIGWEQDEGVARNGGRVGAAGGPAAVVARLPHCGPLLNAERGTDLNNAALKIVKFIGADKKQEEAAIELEEAVHSSLSASEIPIIIGGGNDQSAPNGRAFLRACGGGDSAAVVNIDAHLDVRELGPGGLAHSGTPFRQLLQEKPSLFLAEFAAQGEAVSAEHVSYVKAAGGCVVWLRSARASSGGVEGEFRRLLHRFGSRSVFVSFDIDSICSSVCPGVSAPGVLGLTGEEAIEVAFHAGAWPNTLLLDVSEYNPRIEEDRTGRLVCQIVYAFLCGVVSRKQH